MKINTHSSTPAAMLGVNGAVIVADTGTYAGPFYSIKAITQCVIDTAIFNGDIEGSLDGVTISAGDTVMLYRISTLKLTSGTAIFYKA